MSGADDTVAADHMEAPAVPTGPAVPPIQRVSPHVSSVIMALYNNPTFTVRNSQHISEVKTQTKGLRQGCPLSPYLFSMVLSHLFHDVESQYTALYGLIPGVIHTPSPLWDMEYADDTVLLSKSSQHATRMLHLIQHYGAQRGLHINEEKMRSP